MISPILISSSPYQYLEPPYCRMRGDEVFICERETTRPSPTSTEARVGYESDRDRESPIPTCATESETFVRLWWVVILVFGDCFRCFPSADVRVASFEIRLVDFWSENSTVRVRVLNLFIYISTYLFRKGILFLFVLFLWRLKFNGFVFPWIAFDVVKVQLWFRWYKPSK